MNKRSYLMDLLHGQKQNGINAKVAARILQDTVIGKNCASDKLNGARRLTDAVILGFQLQRSPNRDADIPEWYAVAESELGLGSKTSDGNPLANSCIEEFEILHGDHLGLPDTLNFLKSLAELDTQNGTSRKMREHLAAGGLFNWEVIVEKAERSDIPNIDKKKYLVPADLTVGQFVYVIRKRIKLSAEKAIFIFVDNVLPATGAIMSAIYDEKKDEDGFLYVTYSGENTFGSQDLI